MDVIVQHPVRLASQGTDTSNRAEPPHLLMTKWNKLPESRILVSASTQAGDHPLYPSQTQCSGFSRKKKNQRPPWVVFGSTLAMHKWDVIVRCLLCPCPGNVHAPLPRGSLPPQTPLIRTICLLQPLSVCHPNAGFWCLHDVRHGATHTSVRLWWSDPRHVIICYYGGISGAIAYLSRTGAITQRYHTKWIDWHLGVNINARMFLWELNCSHIMQARCFARNWLHNCEYYMCQYLEDNFKPDLLILSTLPSSGV